MVVKLQPTAVETFLENDVKDGVKGLDGAFAVKLADHSVEQVDSFLGQMRFPVGFEYSYEGVFSDGSVL